MKFFTGKRCRKGHLADRYKASGQCVKCVENYRKTLQYVGFRVHKEDAAVLIKLAEALKAVRKLKNKGVDID